MQNRTWNRIWSETNRISTIAGVEQLTDSQKRLVQSVVEEFIPAPKKKARKARKNGKKRAYTRKAKVDGGSQEAKVVAKKRGRKPKTLSTTDSAGEPETVGAQSSHGEPWEV